MVDDQHFLQFLTVVQERPCLSFTDKFTVTQEPQWKIRFECLFVRDGVFLAKFGPIFSLPAFFN